MRPGCSSTTRCFAARIRQWLKTLRKKNVSVIFATQSLADIKDSSIAPAIIESCASRIFLPNPQATEPQIRTIYEGFGLNSRQIEIVATGSPSATTTTSRGSAIACSTSTWAGHAGLRGRIHAAGPARHRRVLARLPASSASQPPGCAIAASIGPPT
jgi:hypothetical protein